MSDADPVFHITHKQQFMLINIKTTQSVAFYFMYFLDALDDFEKWKQQDGFIGISVSDCTHILTYPEKRLTC